MSGRVRVTLADGRRVTGYRKTLATRSPSIPAHRLPPWVLSFELPGTYGLGLLSYPGIIGVQCWPSGHVEVTGRDQNWVFGQAADLLRHVAPHGLPTALNAVLRRDAEPGPTADGPLRPAVHRNVKIDWNGREATLITGRAMRPMTQGRGHAVSAGRSRVR